MASELDVALANRQSARPIDAERLLAGARRVFADAGVARGEVSLVVVGDAEMHSLNREHLDHDYPTDVLSFVFDSDGDRLEGEIVVSVDTAARQAAVYGWSTDQELLLYVVHGALHLVGHDDKADEPRARMRAAERATLAKLDVPTPPDWERQFGE